MKQATWPEAICTSIRLLNGCTKPNKESNGDAKQAFSIPFRNTRWRPFRGLGILARERHRDPLAEMHKFWLVGSAPSDPGSRSAVPFQHCHPTTLRFNTSRMLESSVFLHPGFWEGGWCRVAFVRSDSCARIRGNCRCWWVPSCEIGKY